MPHPAQMLAVSVGGKSGVGEVLFLLGCLGAALVVVAVGALLAAIRRRTNR